MPKDKEQFDIRKFIRGLNPLNPVAWAKSVVHLFRFLIITAIIIGMIYGIGYWRGKRNAPVQVDMADTKIIMIGHDGNKHVLEIKDGKMTFDERPVKVGDIPSLKPYGVGLHPKAIAGITSSGTPTAGVGLEIAHLYKFNLDLLPLYKFLGIGLSYDLRFDGPIKIDNTSIGLGVGRDFTYDENSMILYMGLEF